MAECPVVHDSGLKSPTGCPVSKDAAAFNPFEGPYQVDPGDALRWARDQEPVFYSPELGYWIVTRYEDVKAVFRDNITFSPSIALEKITPAPEKAMEILKSYDYAMDRTMVNEDEPWHMARRRLLLDDFLPENLKKHEPAVRRLAREYMDRFIDDGQADLVGQMFYEIPLTIALHFLGVPDEDAEKLRQFAVAHTLNTWGRPTEEQQLAVAENVGKFWQTAMRILENMRKNPDGEGWMYETIRQHNKHPDIVPESYLKSMMMAILAAAHETTSNATANAFRILLSNRDAWDDICENPELIPNAVEECLRLGGSIVAWRRIATEAAKVGDVDIPEGGKLLIVMASANKDLRHFENADDFDLYRENSVEHLTFGYGAHQCMGKNIGRMEMRVFLEEFTKRLPHMRLSKQEFSYLSNTSFRGPDELWVEWDPAQNPERKDSALLDQFTEFKIGAPARDSIQRQVVVQEIIEETPDVKRFILADPRGRALPNWTAGAHIDFIAGDWRRKYSLCGDQADSSVLEVAILKEESGRGGSRYFHEHVQAGDKLHIAGPKNHFRLDEGAERYLLIAGGIGITPIMAMADRLKAIGKDYVLHYCSSTRSRMALLDKAKRDHGERLVLHIADEGNRMNLVTELTYMPAGQQVYACGPERLLNALEDLADKWPENCLHFEHFGSVSSELDPEKEHGFTLELRDSDRVITVGATETVYNALAAAGVDIPCDCGEGLCGTCEVEVLEGDIDHRDKVLSKDERRGNNRMMSCCSRVKGDKLVLAL